MILKWYKSIYQNTTKSIDHSPGQTGIPSWLMYGGSPLRNLCSSPFGVFLELMVLCSQKILDQNQHPIFELRFNTKIIFQEKN